MMVFKLRLLPLFIFLLMISYKTIHAQELIETRFLKDDLTEEPTSEKKAKFIEKTYKEQDGKYRYVMTNVETNTIVYDLKYSNSRIKGVPRYDIEKGILLDSLNGEFAPPVFPREKNNFLLYIAKNLRYPFYAAENGIDGLIKSQFVLNENGEITNLSVTEGVDKSLDKEAVRVILNSPTWAPAKLDGKPIKVLITVKTVFIIQ